MAKAAGAGLTRIDAKLDGISTKLDQIAIKAAADAAAFTAFAKSIGAVENAVNNANSSLKELDQVTGDVSVGFGALLDITKALADYGRRGDATSTPAEQQKEADLLAKFEARLKAAFGEDNRFAYAFDTVVQQLRVGLLSPQQAIEVLQANIGPFFEQIQRDLMNPMLDNAQRQLEQALILFLQSGRLY